MSCYIIPIGGTGERVARALLHLAASGALDEANIGEIRLMGIDPDGNSAAGDALKTLRTHYSNLCHAGAFHTEFRLTPGVNEVMLSAVSTPTSSFASLSPVSEEGKDLRAFLYGKDERTLTLEEGFYGHSSIGSYFMAQSLLDKTGNFVPVWKNFFSGIRANDQIILICSMFGGTGAAGAPAIARILRDYRGVGPVTSNATITGIFLEPYFDPQVPNADGGNARVNSAAFPVKSKISLEYYEQEKLDKEIFDNLYILGENAEPMVVAKKEGGADQRNKANIIEFYAAVAAVDAIYRKRKHNPQTPGRVYLMRRGTPNSKKAANVFQHDALWQEKDGQAKPLYYYMARFLAFSVLYSKIFFPMINLKSLRSLASFTDKYDLLEEAGNDYVPNEACKELYKYCLDFMLWFREVSIDIGTPDLTRGFEPGDLQNGRPSPYVTWLSNPNSTLYSGKPSGDTLDKIINLSAFPDMVALQDGASLPPSSEIYKCICPDYREQRAYRRGKIEMRTLRNLIDDVLDQILPL